MGGVALKMLMGDRAKYLGLVFGVAFAVLLITQQSSIFVGLMQRTASVVLDAREADLWVMDPSATSVDKTRPLRATETARVRGVPGVAWAVPLFKANATVRTLEGRVDTMLLMGVDDATLIGVPPAFLLGSLADLRRPDAIAVDRAGFLKLWPGETPALGKVLELNDRRAVVAAVIEASAPFTTTPVAYTRYSQAVGFVPSQRNQLSFILARAEPGRPPAEVAAAITEATALKAVTSTGFVLETIAYYIANTGIPVNFGTVIVLGVIVGVAVVGLTFNMFVAENLKQYAALKAIGVTNGRLVRMVLLQAGVVGATGYAIGLALAAAFFDITSKNAIDLRGFHLPWWIALGAAVLTFVVMVLATLASLRRVLVVDPAMVFRG